MQASKPKEERIRPMLAQAGTYPREPQAYAFEPKWDGIRAIAEIDGGLSLHTRSLQDVTSRYPELAGLRDACAGHRVVLDGEIVALDGDGRPSFGRLQQRMGITEPLRAKLAAKTTPVLYVAFDVLHLDGRDTTALPYDERRKLLEALALDGPAWRTTPASAGDGRAFLDKPGWEGIMAKRLDSRYEPGARSPAWIKIRTTRRQELVIGGWTPMDSVRGGLGALLLGYYDGDRLRYAGSVGTGWDDPTRAALERLLAPDARDASPFDGPVDKPEARFVEPRRVAEITFLEWTADGRLRHPSFKGLRDDKDPRDVVREETD